MSNEIQAYTTSGLTLYAVLLDGSGQVWNGSAFETIAGASWANYDLALTEAAAGVYLGNMPAVDAGVYSYVVYERAGATPATTDTVKGSGSISWSGAAEITPISAGGGASEFTVTVNDESSNPIDGVECWVTSDANGTDVIAGTLSTSASGVVTFMLETGTWYLWRQLSGYNFANPTAIVVS